MTFVFENSYFFEMNYLIIFMPRTELYSSHMKHLLGSIPALFYNNQTILF